jgi:hypothetical protein
MAPSLKINLLSHSDVGEGFVEFDHSGLDRCEHIGHDEEDDEEDVER